MTGASPPVLWNDNNATPFGMTLDQLLYRIRSADADDGLIMDSVTLDDVLEEAEAIFELDALVSTHSSLGRKVRNLERVMSAGGGKLEVVASQVSSPFKRQGVVNVAAILELSDGQTVTVMFHNPDADAVKALKPSDDLISWKWLLNKKDITIVVAPERGTDLPIRQVARRIMKLAERNSRAFTNKNQKRAERLAYIDTLKGGIGELEGELDSLSKQIEIARIEAEDRAFAASQLPTARDGMKALDEIRAFLSRSQYRSLARAMREGHADAHIDRAIVVARLIDGMATTTDLTASHDQATAYLQYTDTGKEWLITHKDAVSPGIDNAYGLENGLPEYIGIDEITTAGAMLNFDFDPKAVSLVSPELEALPDDGDDRPLPVVLTGDELGIFPDTPEGKKALRAAAIESLSMLKGKWLECPALGAKVEVRKRGIKKVESSSADPLKLKILPKIREILASAVKVGMKPNYDSVNSLNIVAYHTLRTEVQVAEQVRAVRIVITEDDKGLFHYDHTLHAVDAILDSAKSKDSTEAEPLLLVGGILGFTCGLRAAPGATSLLPSELSNRHQSEPSIVHAMADLNQSSDIAFDSAKKSEADASTSLPVPTYKPEGVSAPIRVAGDRPYLPTQGERIVPQGSPNHNSGRRDTIEDSILDSADQPGRMVFNLFIEGEPPEEVIEDDEEAEAEQASTAQYETPAATNEDAELDPEGAPNLVKTAKGTEVQTGFTVVEADELIASHDINGTPNPAFPAELQPRDRGRDASIAWVKKTARQLDPDSLGRTRRADTGAPIIGPDRVVESGNGRTMAIQEAYRSGNADEYRGWLIEEAHHYQLDAERVRAMKAPVLVRVRTSALDRREFAVEANQDDKLSMTGTEKARADADRLDEGLIVRLSDDGNLLAASNRGFIMGFLQSLGDTEAAQYMTRDGNPTGALIARIQAAIFARAYNDDRLLEMTADASRPEVANVVNALNVAAPEFIRAQDADQAGTDALTNQLVDSVEASLNEQAIQAIIDATHLVRRARAEGASVEEVVNQRGLFGDIPPATAAMALFINQNNRSAKRLGLAFRAMASFVRQEAERGQTVDMFGEGQQASLEQIIDAANRELEKEYGEGSYAIESLDLFSATSASDEPIAEEKPIDGEGMGAPSPQGGIRLYHGTAKGNVFSRFDASRAGRGVGMNHADQGDQIYLTVSIRAAEWFAEKAEVTRQFEQGGNPGLNEDNSGTVLAFMLDASAQVLHKLSMPRGSKSQKVIQQARDAGFDAIAFPDQGFGTIEGDPRVGEMYSDGAPPTTYIILNESKLAPEGEVGGALNEDDIEQARQATDTDPSKEVPVADPLEQARAMIQRDEFKSLTRDFTLSLATIKGIDAGTMPGMERSLFVNSITGKIKTRSRRDPLLAGVLLAWLSEQQKGWDKPAVTMRNAVWKSADNWEAYRPLFDREAMPSVPAAGNEGGEGRTEPTAPESEEETMRRNDRQFLQSVIDGTVSDILSPELADQIIAVMERQSGDSEMEALIERAGTAYERAMLNATEDL